MDAESFSEADLTRAAGAGSMPAFEQLVRLYESRVFSFITVLCRNREDAREITQDTFVRAFQAMPKFDPEQPFGPWLFTIARRKFIDHCRTKGRSYSHDKPEESDLNTPAELMARREDAAELWRVARHILPDLQFQAIWLRYAEDMDVSQVSSVLGRSQTHVKVLLFRARMALAKRLEGNAPATLAPNIYLQTPGQDTRPTC
jgi:RNA polymerase sigma-70 factor, ECF subfamily